MLKVVLPMNRKTNFTGGKTVMIMIAGVIISKVPLYDVVPVELSKDGKIVTEYTMIEDEHIGLLKMDFLGLRNLTIIHNALKLIEKRTE